VPQGGQWTGPVRRAASAIVQDADRFVICEERSGYSVWLRVQVGSSVSELRQWVSDRLRGAEWESAYEGWWADPRGADDDDPTRPVLSVSSCRRRERHR
jgi:hypothetical protein